MAFLIGGANSAVSGYDIDNSCRFDDAGDNNLLFQMGTPTDGKKHTVSCWVKKSRIGGGSQNIFTAEQEEGSPYDGSGVYFGGGANDYLTYNHATGGSSYTLTSAAQYRDPSAWYHVVCHTDSTDGTAADRMKMYVNGERVTAFSNTPSDFPEDGLPNMNMSGENHRIGVNETNDNGLSAPWDGYISEFYFIDGQALTPSSFGETNDDGIWVPKDFAGTYGDNGIRCEFKGTGTNADASGIGADTSGNTNHLTVTDLTAVDMCTDTPTNNFATINSVWAGLSARVAPTLSEGNTQVDHGSTDSGAWSTIIPANGKWYAEFKATNTSSNTMGIAVQNLTDGEGSWRADTYQNAKGYMFFMTGNTGNNGGYTTSYGSAWSDDDIIGTAMDLTNGKLYFAINNTWQDSGDPTSGATGTGAAFSIDAGDSHALGSAYKSDLRGQWNFGNPTFAISSGNADANGYGNFEYAPPSGYYALCTKNLAEYG